MRDSRPINWTGFIATIIITLSLLWMGMLIAGEKFGVGPYAPTPTQTATPTPVPTPGPTEAPAEQLEFKILRIGTCRTSQNFPAEAFPSSVECITVFYFGSGLSEGAAAELSNFILGRVFLAAAERKSGYVYVIRVMNVEEVPTVVHIYRWNVNSNPELVKPENLSVKLPAEEWMLTETQ